jgi:hypothetical protein
MKLHLLLLALLISSTLFAQQRDTVFLKREITDNPYPFYHAIYIDSTDEIRNALTSFTFNNFDSATYSYHLERLRPLKRNINSIVKDFPKKWIALYIWKNDYYLYYPSDFGNHARFEITDSTTVDFSMEGPEPSRLNKLSFLSPTQLLINRSNYWEGKKVNINLIEKSKGIAVFTFSPSKYNKEGYHRLFVDATKAYLFPIIVNYCKTDKQGEFEFDKIDFKRLTN